MTHKDKERRLLGAMLRIPFQAIVTRIYTGLNDRGFTDLSPAHFVIFQHLRLEGSRITELAEQAQITKQSMGALVNYAVSRGYLTYLPDPSDGRAKVIHLTERGWALDDAARELLADVEKEWADALGNDRIVQLKETLKDVISLLES